MGVHDTETVVVVAGTPDGAAPGAAAGDGGTAAWSPVSGIADIAAAGVTVVPETSPPPSWLATESNMLL